MLTTITGDAAISQTPHRHTLIVHVCNDRGGWGRGFVTALSRSYPEAEQAYRAWAEHGATSSGLPFALCEVQFVATHNPKVVVGNMLAQSGYVSRDNPHPLRMDALEECLRHVRSSVEDGGVFAAEAPVIQMPRIGAGLGGGHWDAIEALINACLGDYAGGVHVVIPYAQD